MVEAAKERSVFMHNTLWNKDYLLMLQGGAVSSLGDILYSVAIGYWVYEQTGSSALMGILSSISMFMTMFLMPFSGTIIDKCNRKAVIVGMDALRGLLMLSVGALAGNGNLSVFTVLAAAFLSSACTTFFTPAVSTLMIDLIPPDDMVRGQALQSGVNTALNLVGKAFSGALVVLWGVPVIIFAYGISYLLSAFTELFITIPRQQSEAAPARNVLTDFRQSLKTLWANPFLRLFIPGAMLVNFLCSGSAALMLPFVLEKGFSVEQYGYLMGLETTASLLGICLLGLVKLKPGARYWVMALGYPGTILFAIPAYLTGSYPLLCILLFLSCFCNTLGNGIGNAALALALPEGNRGSILGLVNAAAIGGSALSAVVYGFLCEYFPLYLVFIAGYLLAVLPILRLCLHRVTKAFVLSH